MASNESKSNNNLTNGNKRAEEKWEKPLPAEKTLIFDNV